MKLNSAQLERTLGQFEARAIPDDHPVIPQLNDLFGEHTFFLDRNGLNIVEPAEAAAGAAAQSAKVVNLGSGATTTRLVSSFMSLKQRTSSSRLNPGTDLETGLAAV